MSAWINIPNFNAHYDTEELNLYRERDARRIWDEIIDRTTNVPGVLVEDNLSSSSNNPVFAYTSNTQTDVFVPDSFQADAYQGNLYDNIFENLSEDDNTTEAQPAQNQGYPHYRIINNLGEDDNTTEAQPVQQPDNLYDKIFENLKEGDHTTEAEPSKAIITKLYPHQKQALNWMIEKENKKSLPPFWEQRDGYCYNTLTRMERKKVKSIYGGILADDMGLGKTLVVISLILTNFKHGKPLAIPSSCRNLALNDKAQKRSMEKGESNYTSSSKTTCEKTSSFEGCNSHLYHKWENSRSPGSSERAGKRVSIKEEKEEDEVEGKHSPAKNGRWDDNENFSDDSDKFKDLKPLPPLDTEEFPSFWPDSTGQCSSLHKRHWKKRVKKWHEESNDFNRISLFEPGEFNSFLNDLGLKDFPSGSTRLAKPLKLEPVGANCENPCSNNSDSVIEVSDCDSIITILDSDEEATTDLKHNSSKKDPVDEESLETIQSPQESEQALSETVESSQESEHNDDTFESYDSVTGRHKTKGRRGTLIICPTSVLHNWQEQFDQHVDSTTNVKVYVHYGKNRKMDEQFMKDQDIVVTTYHTVIADKKSLNNGPIRNTKWLRIVLDEGHTIRNPRTQMAKAINELNAKRKWVISGTPIQNSMEDLWSLINFLKVEPLTDKRLWNRTIAYPLALKDDATMERVFHLMRNLALRRTKTQQVNGKPVLDLPARNVVLKRLELSQSQREAYDRLEKEGRILIRKCIENNSIRDHLLEIYLAKLRLRQFCCHPMLVYKACANKLAQADAASLTANGSLEANSTVIAEQETTCTICLNSPKNAVIISQDHVYCWTCIQINPAFSSCQPNSSPGEVEINVAEIKKLKQLLMSATTANEECIICTKSLKEPVITPKGHLYCLVCFRKNPEITQALESITAIVRHNFIGKLLMWLDFDDTECPICFSKSTDIGSKNAVITFCGHEFCKACIERLLKNELQAACPICRKQISKNTLIEIPHMLAEGASNIDDWQSSSKLESLMTTLIELRQQDPRIKSIVVSQFTSLLDLVECALREKGFEFTRLDGKMSQKKRVAAITAFSDTKDGSPTIFLLSLKAGGVGINLTAASRVFLMDPAWNPSCEEQCFDRCHRLGQIKDVEITKYIIENSVEENMLKLQDRKRQLMTGAFLKKPSREERRTEYINDLKDFFDI